MSRGLSYVDAVRILGVNDSKIVKLVDGIAGGALVVGTVLGLPQLLALFDFKAEALHLGSELIDATRKRFRERSGHSRTERLSAAHSVLVITAYFEAFDALELPLTKEKIDLSAREQVALAGGMSVMDANAGLVERLVSTSIPLPSPAQPYEQTREKIEKFYKSFSGELAKFVAGLSVGESLGETRLRQFVADLRHRVPEAALVEYDNAFLRLAADAPELFLWANLQDHQATRLAVRQLGDETGRSLRKIYQVLDDVHTGLAGIERIYALGGISNTAQAASSLAIIGRQELDWPIVDSRTLNANAQLTFPRLADAYINPTAKVAEIEVDSRPGSDSWWISSVTFSDVQTLLAGQLRTQEATQIPTVILGSPGAGKSLLTRVLTARLSEAGLLAVHVELRFVSPNALIQRQIEEGIERATGERISWPELVRSNPDVQRVVILDGLDELVQSSQVSRSDYLELVQDFQEREHTLGRPTAVIVTSRTVVASRTRFPLGTTVVYLEQFNDAQISEWLAAWNKSNNDYFRANGLEPTSRDVVRRYRDLAVQPLLLTLLTIFDADGNALQAQGDLNTAELYEQLLSRFARREVIIKDEGSGLTSNKLSENVEIELQRLSITAMGMFIRGRQWISVDELNHDLKYLSPRSVDVPSVDGGRFNEPLTPADVTVGRFFFIHESRMEGDRSHHTYEFMHATFGEYLFARLVVRAALDINARRIAARSPWALPPTDLDDGLLFALLSFEPLSSRSSIIGFIDKLLDEAGHRKEGLKGLLIRIFRRSLFGHPSRSYSNYAPVEQTLAARLAIYNANILLLIAAVSPIPVEVVEIFGTSGDVGDAWRRHVYLWRSIFPSGAAWSAFTEMLSIGSLDDPRAYGEMIAISLRSEEVEATRSGHSE